MPIQIVLDTILRHNDRLVVLLQLIRSQLIVIWLMNSCDLQKGVYSSAATATWAASTCFKSLELRERLLVCLRVCHLYGHHTTLANVSQETFGALLGESTGSLVVRA